jgi:hypothetical protein
MFASATAPGSVAPASISIPTRDVRDAGRSSGTSRRSCVFCGRSAWTDRRPCLSTFRAEGRTLPLSESPRPSRSWPSRYPLLRSGSPALAPELRTDTVLERSIAEGRRAGHCPSSHMCQQWLRQLIAASSSSSATAVAFVVSSLDSTTTAMSSCGSHALNALNPGLSPMWYRADRPRSVPTNHP